VEPQHIEGYFEGWWIVWFGSFLSQAGTVPKQALFNIFQQLAGHYEDRRSGDDWSKQALRRQDFHRYIGATKRFHFS